MMFRKLLMLDAKYSERLRLNPNRRGWWQIASFLAHSGDSWFWATGLGIVWLFSRSDWHARSATLLIGVVAMAFLVLAIKFKIRRQRPEGDWGSIYRNTDPHSFPSGHATRAGLLVVGALFLGPAWFAAAVAIWAPLMSMSRVVMGVHYLSDVIAGFVFGILSGWILVLIQPFLITLFPFIF